MKETEWKISLCWVKAHAGIKGNEVADTLAKRAATNRNIPES
jgi:ribonuclease HI